MRNVFALTFGILIQQKRNKKGISSTELAERLMVGGWKKFATHHPCDSPP